MLRGGQNVQLARTEPGRKAYAANSSKSAFASFRSRVSNLSVNHPYTGASSSRACCTLP